MLSKSLLRPLARGLAAASHQRAASTLVVANPNMDAASLSAVTAAKSIGDVTVLAVTADAADKVYTN